MSASARNVGPSPDVLGDLAACERAFDEREPAVQAFLPEPGRFRRLREEAEALLARYPDRGARPPLFGTLLGVKDVFRVRGFATGAGSRLPADLFAGAEASTVTRLRDAGALVVGKTVSTEFAYFAPGATRNPHDPGRTPGGSSSGSAAAVGAGLCGLALGTQTIGSIGRPASFCGAVGFKPSFGRVPIDGVIPLAPSLDHVGIFTASAGGALRAAAVLLDGFATVTAIPSDVRLRCAIPNGPYLNRADAEGRAHFDATCAALDAGGCELVEIAVMADFDAIEARHRRIVAAEAAAVHAEWFARYAELYAPQTAELIRRGRDVSAAQLEDDLAGRALLRRELGEALGDLQVWLSPPARGAAPRGLESTGDPVMNLPWTHAGVPTIVLPAGCGGSGMPIGLQLAGRFDEDERLLATALTVERILAAGEVGE